MKRVLSLFLAFVMLIALLPSTVLFAAAESTEYVYMLRPWDYHKPVPKEGYKLGENGMPRYTEYSSGTYAEGERNWIFHSMTDDTYAYWNESATTTPAKDGRGVAGFDGGGVSFTPIAEGEWFALKFRAPEAGIYKIAYQTIYDTAAKVTGLEDNASISIFPGTIMKEEILALENDTNNINYLVSSGIDFNNSTIGESTERVIGSKVIAANKTDEELVIAVTSNSGTKIRMRNFKLIKVSDEITLYDFEENPINDEFVIANSERGKVEAKLSQNTLLGYIKPVYKTGSSAVATVDETGVITPASAGWTTLTVTIGDFSKTIALGVKDENGSVPGEKPSLVPELSFPKEFIHVAEKIQITNADSSYTYKSSDENIATVDESGKVLGVSVGKVKITASRDGEEDKIFEFPVVGKNLINRSGNDHSHFEKGIYFTDGSGTAKEDDTFWAANRAEVNYVFDYAKTSGNLLPGRSAAVTAAKFSFDGKGATDPAKPNDPRISLRVFAPQVALGSNKNYGIIAADKNKLYEFSGWIAAEKTEHLASDISFTAEYYDSKNLKTALTSTNAIPWKNKAGDQPWEMFTVPSIILSDSSATATSIRPWLQTVTKDKVGDILLTEFSVHEVVYDRMEIIAAKTEIEASETLSFSAKHYSNTGNIIKQLVNGKAADAAVSVAYESSDKEVVRVIDDNGTLIGVGDGTATITATATICGVTQTETVDITVSGGKRPEFIKDISLEIKGENIYPASYAKAVAIVRNEAGEKMTLSQDEITYASSNEAVATVDKNGVIRAKTAGDTVITVTAKKNGTEATATATLTVSELPAETEIPEVIGAYFQTDFTHVGEENTIIVTDMNGDRLGSGVNYTYEIADESIITEKDGVFTGKKIGRTVITVKATLGGVTREAEVPVVVVGANLLIRKGVNHGEFENGVYINDGSGAPTYSSFWLTPRNDARGHFAYELLSGSFSEITGKPTNIAKFTMPGEEVTDNIKLIRMQGTTDTYDENKDSHLGIVVVNGKKLYEYSGYIKTENTVDLPEKACGTLGYYSGKGSSITELGTAYKSSPWIGKSGNQKWTKFNVAPIYMNWDGVSTYSLRPGVDAETPADNRGYDFFISHLSLHEVVFDKAEFNVKGSFGGAKTYDTFETEVKLLSNTGAEILSGNANKKFEFVYASSDESVARVSEDGIITAVSDGSCTVTVTTTLLGVTKTGTIDVEFSGLDVLFDRIEADVPETMEIGDTHQIIPTYISTDDTIYTGKRDIYYESEDPSIVYVDKNGQLTAKKAGKTVINAFVIVGERIVKHSFAIKVNDATELVSASISGKSVVEKGFTIVLTPSAMHESALAADLDDCTVEFFTSDENILTVTNEGVVTGTGEGAAYVTLVVSMADGRRAESEPFEITVTPPQPKSKIFDFTGYTENTSVLDATIEKNGFEANRDLSSPNILSGNLGTFRFLSYGISANPANGGNSRKSDTVLDLKIDYDGWYEIDFKGAQIVQGAKLAYIYVDGVYIGEYCFVSEGSDNPDGPVAQLNTVWLDTGVHQFTIRSIQEGRTGSLRVHSYFQTASKIWFNYIAEEPKIQEPIIEVDRTSLAVGESSAIKITVPMSNGRNHNFGLLHGNKEDKESNLKITSSDENVVKYENGRLVATGVGSAAIKVSALVFGNPSESTVTITVTEETLSRVENLNVEGIVLYVGDVADIELRAFVKGAATEEREISVDDLELSYELVGGEIATVADKKITAMAVGNASLAVTATLGGMNPITSYIPVSVIEDGYAYLELNAVTQVIKYGGEGTDLFIKAYDNFDKLIDTTAATAVYTVSDESVIVVDETGRITPIGIGVATIRADVTIDGITHSDEVTVSVRDGKVSSTYYTKEKVEAAQENVKKYDWAKEKLKSAVEKADIYVEQADYIVDVLTNHTIPRSCYVGSADDPILNNCPYCNADLQTMYANHCWAIDMINRPWKMQCRECKRLFPSNDFESFYNNGLDEHGEFDRQLALENNGILCGRGERINGEYVVKPEFADNPYGYGDPKGNLYNEMYSELYPEGSLDPRAKKPITQGWGDFKVGGDSGVPTAGYFWGVDDSRGYDTGRVYTEAGFEGVKEIHYYVASINYRGIWYIYGGGVTKPLMQTALTSLTEAYVYTGEKKYGIAGAKILDRIADLYPDFDYGADCENLVTSGNGSGKISGYIHENYVNRILTTAYDAFFDVYDEPELIEFCSEKAKEWNLDNKKTNGELLRQNVEDNILLETWEAVKVADIRGNFGHKQETLIKAAIILDREPETSEMVDLAMRSGIDTGELCTGAGLYSGIMNRVDRDGYGDESSTSYNSIFSESLCVILEDMENYGKLDLKYDLSKNPRALSLLTIGGDTVVGGRGQANFGDFGSNLAMVRMISYSTIWLSGLKLTGNPLFAQLLYLANGNSVEGIKYDIFTKDPESVQDEIQAVIDEYGEYDVSKSIMLTGHGFASLNDGVKYDQVTATTKADTMRSWWMYSGIAQTPHKHADAHNLGIMAYGIDFAPDLGYEGSIGATWEMRQYWTMGTISHNTVVVNDRRQERINGEGYPLHFDDAGSVKVMDSDAPQVNFGDTDTYRRTIVSIDVDDTVSYALDFFRIVGGDEHVYSFHSQSEQSTVTGVTLEKQPRGTYAGVDVPYGDLSYTADNGYQYIENVERAIYPGTGEFSVDFKITDYNKYLDGKRNLHLKLTQLNDFEISELARADGRPVLKPGAPKYIDYVFVRRSGKNLDTLFTSVIEPYEDNSKICNIKRVDVIRRDGGSIPKGEPVVAVKVELVNGRTDYIVYASNNSVAYTITDPENGVSFDFCGFVGVYTVNNEDVTDVIRTYIQDGTQIGEATREYAALTGEVVNFTDKLNEEDGEPVLDNFLEVTVNEAIEPENLVGKMIIINNDGVLNGAYMIESAEKKGNNILLGTGDVNFIRNLDENEQIVWNIEKGQSYRIPMSSYDDVAPKISVQGTFTTSAGSLIEIPVVVTSDREYTLIGTSLPRGMSLNAEKGVLIWKPTASQVGNNHVAVTADNGVMSDTVHFQVTVYGSTTSKPSDKTENPSSEATDAPTGGGGGGDAPPPTDNKTEDETGAAEGENGESTGNGEKTEAPSGDGEAVRFIDLGNHAWAADAINELADAGIINGTSVNTFSPANNITRADFALLLVRAFKLTSENEENFDDVFESDYFARELAVARNTGIVSGIGDNKYAPSNTITRQDMMLIVYRALTTLNAEFDESVEPQYDDFNAVADYARDAVSALIGAELVNGKNGLIAPTDSTTRAEVAVLIKRILEYIK